MPSVTSQRFAVTDAELLLAQTRRLAACGGVCRVLTTVVDALSFLLNALCPAELHEHAANYGLTAL